MTEFDFNNFILFKTSSVEKRNATNTLNFARIVTNETPKFYVADVQRRYTPRQKTDNMYSFPSYGRYKFKKDDTYPKVKKSSSVIETIEKATTPKEVHSLFNNPCSYSELFQTHFEELFNKEDDYNLDKIISYSELLKVSEKDAKMSTYENLKLKYFFDSSDDIKNIHFKSDTIEWLKKLFNVPKVYILKEYCYSEDKSKLSKTGTFLHINHFGGTKNKEITSKNNCSNITCLFWLFDDKLVISRQSGFGSW